MRKVSYIKFHSTSYLPGIGELPAILPSQSKKIDNLEMWDTDGVELLICCTDKAGKKVTAGIPKAAAQLYVYAEAAVAEVQKAS